MKAEVQKKNKNSCGVWRIIIISKYGEDERVDSLEEFLCIICPSCEESSSQALEKSQMSG